MKKYKRVILLLADGARPDILNNLLEEGALPSIKKYLVDPGTNINAVTAFPSTTGPAYMPFLTGCLPATCNVPGIRWLDKVRFAKNRFHFSRYRSYVGLETYLIGNDMRRELPTLFELITNSYNVFNSVNKGVGFWGNKTRISRIWYWYYAHLTDHWNFVDTSAIHKFKKLMKKDFELIFLILPGVDEYSHIDHYKNEETIKAYRKVDDTVRLAYEELSKRGMWEDTLFWLVSDHGLSHTHSHYCMNTFLEDRGIKTFYYPKIFRKGCVAANMMSGNGMTHLYFKHDRGWQYPIYKDYLEKKYPGMIDEIVSNKAVDILACKKDLKTVHVVTKKGKADIMLEGDRIGYKVIDKDPFGYGEMKREFTSFDSLADTINTEYPDATYQLAHLFTSPRTGDVVLSAAKGFDLRDEYEVPEHKGSHGSLHKEHMLVPLICNHKFKERVARTVDVFPTTLDLLGLPCPGNIDGKGLSR